MFIPRFQRTNKIYIKNKLLKFLYIYIMYIDYTCPALTLSSFPLSPSQFHILFLLLLINLNPISAAHMWRGVWLSTGVWTTYQSFIIKEKWLSFPQQLLTAYSSFHKGRISVAPPPSTQIVWLAWSCPDLMKVTRAAVVDECKSHVMPRACHSFPPHLLALKLFLLPLPRSCMIKNWLFKACYFSYVSG